MSISISFPEQSKFIYPLQVSRRVDRAKFSVYRVYCKFNNTNYALKIFPIDKLGTSHYNKEKISFAFNHPNIIKRFPATITSNNNAPFFSVLTEFAQYGDLFDLMSLNVFDSDLLIRTYFHQVVAGVEYMHSQGVAHLDLKLENLMLGDDFNLKIIDFDQAQLLSDKRLTSAGTSGYRAPEVINRRCQDFKAADIYSLGIILFTLKSQSRPFVERKVEQEGGNSFVLEDYSTFLSDNSAFWDMMSQKKNAGFFGEDFKELINSMLQSDVCRRATLKDVRNSKWFKGPVLGPQGFKIEMESRLELVYRMR